jgi:hypothetical protein
MCIDFLTPLRPIFVVEWLTPLPPIREVPTSNLDQDTDYTVWGFRGPSQSLHANAGVAP